MAIDRDATGASAADAMAAFARFAAGVSRDEEQRLRVFRHTEPAHEVGDAAMAIRS